MPENVFDVVISGAGPNGLMLAAELALAGVRPIVLDRLSEPSAEPKANGLVGQVVRLLDLRGLYNEFSGRPGPPQPAPGYIFSGLTLNLQGLPDNPLYGMVMPQPKLVRLLAQRALGLGVDIRWGHELTDLIQGEGGVVAIVGGPTGEYRISTRFLVGADGGKSLVRKRIGVEFPGFTSDSVTRMGHVSVPDELRGPDGGLEVPGGGRLRFGHNRLERGMVAFATLEPGRSIIAVAEYDGEPVSDDTAMTFPELRDSVRRVLGVDLPIQPPAGPGPHALRRSTGQNTRLAERYREGSALLLGDAAHVHSAIGGPGLNLGLQDAVNLGWKLAAHLDGWAPADLLDTYQSERHPVGERVMMSSLAQTGLMRPGPEVTALRQLFTELLQSPEATGRIANLMAGSDVHYETGDNHPLSGRLAPDLTLETRHGRVRVAELLHRARPVLLDLTDESGYAAIADGWSDRVDTVTATCPEAPAAALLIRPDGYLAWAAGDGDRSNSARLRAALSRWFGPGRDVGRGPGGGGDAEADEQRG